MIMARNIQIFRKTSKNHISSATEWCKLSNFFGTRCELVICRDNLYSLINISKWPQSRFKLHWQTLVHTVKMQGFDVDDSKKVVWKCNFAFLHHFSIIPIHYAGKMYFNHHGVILEPALLRQEDKIENLYSSPHYGKIGRFTSSKGRKRVWNVQKWKMYEQSVQNSFLTMQICDVLVVVVA